MKVADNTLPPKEANPPFSISKLRIYYPYQAGETIYIKVGVKSIISKLPFLVEHAYKTPPSYVELSGLQTEILGTNGFPFSDGNFVAQLYVAKQLEELRPVGSPTAVTSSGLQRQPIFLLDVPPGTKLQAQVRVWDSTKGTTYELARQNGSEIGRSSFFELISALDEFNTIPPVSGSFQLVKPITNFGGSSLTLTPGSAGQLWINITGQPGFHYVIEARTNQFWQPLTIISNSSGTILYYDDTPKNRWKWFRSRLLD